MKKTRLFAASEWTVNEFSFSAWKREQTKAYAFAPLKKTQCKEKNQAI